jgi:IS66 Orf2 like protein
MGGLGPATKGYLAVGPTDLRKGFDGLDGVARDALGVDPLSAHLALFCNRQRTRREDFVLGWPRFVGLRQTVRAGSIQLAHAGPGVGWRGVKSGGVFVVNRRH